MSEFSFSDSAATNYDTLLVPIIFEPWAKDFLDGHTDWSGKTVLDLACGTGIVSSLLPGKVATEGSIVSVDLNPDMLALARKRCESSPTPIRFITSSADAIELDDQSVDIAVCQQGFQFFPDKPAAASEIKRVLRPEGTVMVSTWRRIEECDAFNVIVEALESIGETDTANLMRTPFDFLSAEELESAFSGAGFQQIEVRTVSRTMELSGGVQQALHAVYGTPIAGKLHELPEEKKTALNEKLAELYGNLSPDGKQFGELRTNLLTARR